MIQVTPKTFTIELGNPDDPQVAALLRRSEDFAYALYPAESIHMLPVEQLKTAAVSFLIARDNTTRQVLGCGAFILQADSCAELKRMFVDTAARRQGIAAEILTRLEQIARIKGINTLRLETGVNQREAISLYHRFGYRERARFGEYSDDPLSVFMEKFL